MMSSYTKLNKANQEAKCHWMSAIIHQTPNNFYRTDSASLDVSKQTPKITYQVTSFHWMSANIHQKLQKQHQSNIFTGCHQIFNRLQKYQATLCQQLDPNSNSN